LILTWVASSTSSSPTWEWFSAISIYMPSLYLVLTSTSTLCKVACGMAAGATKGNITDHFAISGNRADCQSKESTQETLVSLVGMCCGVWLANILSRLEKIGTDDQVIGRCIDGDFDGGGSRTDDDTCANNEANKMMVLDVQFISWSIFIILTLVHVWANFVGMQMLRLQTLNQERAKVALQSLIEDCGLWALENQNENNSDHGNASHNGNNNEKAKAPTSQANISKRLVIDKASTNILPPKSVSESLWKSMCGMVFPGNIRLGMRLKDLVLRSSSSKRRNATRRWSWGQWDCENYLIFVDEDDERDEKEKRNESMTHRVVVLLREGSSDRDELKAFVHAHVLEWSLQHNSCHPPMLTPKILSRSYEMIQNLFQPIDGTIPDQTPEDAFDLYNILREKGWDMTRLYLGFDPHRCEWQNDNG